MQLSREVAIGGNSGAVRPKHNGSSCKAKSSASPRREPPSASCDSSSRRGAARLEAAPAQVRELAELVPEDWEQPVPHHRYSLGQIAGALALVLECRSSLRGSALALGLLNRLAGVDQKIPSAPTLRAWLLRLGLYQLQQPVEQAEDWVWIADHTVQVGELRCLFVVGMRLSVWEQQADRCLSHEDVELIGLWPVRTSTGEVVDEQLQEAVARTGQPRLIISDDGGDLRRGVALFRERCAEVDPERVPAWIYDIKHKTAILLKHELEPDPVWKAFATRANQAKRHVHQTELAFTNPPQQRGKARYMNVDTLVQWGQKVLKWLDSAKGGLRAGSAGGGLDEERIEAKLAWLREYREPLGHWGQAMEVIGTVETLVRKEGYHAGSRAELATRLPAVEPGSLAERLRDKLTAFVGEQAALARDGEHLPGSSEVLESIIGKYKWLQGDNAHFGVTGMLLSVGAFVGKLTLQSIYKALTTVSGATLEAWEKANLGTTIHSQRKQAFPSRPSGTKTGTTQLTLAPDN